MKRLKAYRFPLLLLASVVAGSVAGWFLGPKSVVLKPLGDIFLESVVHGSGAAGVCYDQQFHCQHGNIETIGTDYGYFIVGFCLDRNYRVRGDAI